MEDETKTKLPLHKNKIANLEGTGGGKGGGRTTGLTSTSHQSIPEQPSSGGSDDISQVGKSGRSSLPESLTAGSAAVTLAK